MLGLVILAVVTGVIGAAEHGGRLEPAAALWILGKQACSLGVLERGVDRLTVGIGMIPRGESSSRRWSLRPR